MQRLRPGGTQRQLLAFASLLPLSALCQQAGDIAWLTGTATMLGWPKAQAAKYEPTGEVDYVAGIDETDMDVGMPASPAGIGTMSVGTKVSWDKRFAVMSDDDLLPHETISAARVRRNLHSLIRSDSCFLPDAAHRHFESTAASGR